MIAVSLRSFLNRSLHSYGCTYGSGGEGCAVVVQAVARGARARHDCQWRTKCGEALERALVELLCGLRRNWLWLLPFQLLRALLGFWVSAIQG